MEKNNKVSPKKPLEPKPKKGSGLGVVIFLSVLAVLMAVGGAFLLREYLNTRYEAQLTSLAIQEVSQERDLLLQQLKELDEKYAHLTQEHSELEALFAQERRRVNRLSAQLSGGPGEDAAGLSQYRERVQELESQLQSYQQQLEAMKSENQALAGENAQMRSTLSQTTSRNQELESRNKKLEDQMEKASYLTVSGLEATALRERRRGDEPTDRARRTDKLRICFTVNENLVAEPGNRDFFVRLINPSNQVMTISPDNTLVFEGETIQYSLKRTVNYQRSSQNVCVMWDQDERFEKGYYNVVVFHDGREVGYKLFQLD